MGEEILGQYLRSVRIKKVINHVPRGILVDLGCGKGQFLKKASNKIIRGIGFDGWDGVKEGNIELKNLILGKKIPLNSNSVDCVTMLASLEHFEYPVELLMDSHRILKNGGVLLITTPARKAKGLLEFLGCNLKVISPKDIGEHKRYFDKTELINILTNKCKFSKVTPKTFQFGLNNLVIAYK